MKLIKRTFLSCVAIVATGFGLSIDVKNGQLDRKLSVQNVQAMTEDAVEPPMASYSCDPVTSSICTIRLNEVLIQGIGQPKVIY